jgi:hypothetical protein
VLVCRPEIAPVRRIFLVITLVAVSPSARALDKQGSAHGGGVGGESTGFGLSGSLILGASVYNPTYAARPDNTGLALMRYAAHADVDLLGRHLSIPLDVNMFTDRTLDGVEKLKPTELDLIGGVTSTWGVGKGAVEGGVRAEHDRTLGGGPTQTYVDARARALYSLAAIFPGLGPALNDGDVSGWATLGWFVYNPNYYARPDNTGRALLRYGLHTEISTWQSRLALGLDASMFTDRQASNVVRPSELDFTPELILRLRAFELHAAYERDMPVDRGGLVQHFVYLLGVWSFTAI